MNETPFDELVPVINYLAFRKCQPEWRIRPHVVDNYDITYIIKGKARYIIDGEIIELEAGDVLYLTDGMEKQAITYPNSLMHCFSVNFSPKYPGVKAVPPEFPRRSHIGAQKDIIEMFQELTINWTGQQSGYRIKTRALLMLILHRLSEIILYKIDSTFSGDYRINKIIRYISMHYSEKLTVKELADRVHLDTAYFGHLFKQETGMTVHQYMTQVRVRNAENMLRSGNCKVGEAAESCGFSDVFHFYKSFKLLRGFPPSRCIP